MKEGGTTDYLESLVKALPAKPGVYQFFDEEENLIYVGKAKDLKKRVSSYFSKVHDNAKTRILVRRISNIRHIVVETETDALLLENNLIKKYQPRYNVLLKDDKTYPWICIKKESFPRIFYTRNVVKDGSAYFGPFTSISLVKLIIDLMHQIYSLRTCSLMLTEENINKGKFKVCLDYHIKKCLGPCVGKYTEDEYNEGIRQIHDILKGNVGVVIKALKEKMNAYAETFDYEMANVFKHKIQLLQNYQSKSTIVNPDLSNIDVYSIIDDKDYAYINFLKVINGAIIQVYTIEMKKKMDETKEDLLPLGIISIREKFMSLSKEIIIPFEIEFEVEGVKFSVPVRGDKKKLLELSEKNVKYYRLEKMKQIENIDPQKNTNRILKTLQTDFHLNDLPVHIECFDNSNIQGTNPVASCVVFRNAKPSPKEYRHFNIKTVEGPDDFASMKEIVYRRYKRLIDENHSLPQLIVIDGGKGQLNAALESIESLDLRGKIAIIGIAKRLEEIYFPGDSVPVYLDKNSESLKIIQHARNEAHRFGITFHRTKRSQNFLKSELEKIPGLGSKTIEKLYSNFGSLEKIKNSNSSDLEKIIGAKKAQLLSDFLKNEK